MNLMKVLCFRVPNTQCITQDRNRDRRGYLANDKLPFRLIEIVYGNFEVELEKNEE